MLEPVRPLPGTSQRGNGRRIGILRGWRFVCGQTGGVLGFADIAGWRRLCRCGQCCRLQRLVGGQVPSRIRYLGRFRGRGSRCPTGYRVGCRWRILFWDRGGGTRSGSRNRGGGGACGRHGGAGEVSEALAAAWRRRALRSWSARMRPSRGKRSATTCVRRSSGMIFRPERYSLHTLLLSRYRSSSRLTVESAVNSRRNCASALASAVRPFNGPGRRLVCPYLLLRLNSAFAEVRACSWLSDFPTPADLYESRCAATENQTRFQHGVPPLSHSPRAEIATAKGPP